MNSERIESAAKRIEAAIARIEAASSRTYATTSDLKARHEQLRAIVTGSLGQLDALIALQNDGSAKEQDEIVQPESGWVE